MGFCHKLITKTKDHLVNFFNCLTANELEELLDIGATESEGESSCLKRIKYNVRRKECVNLKTDADNLNTASKIKKLIWILQKTNKSWQNEIIYWATLTYSTSGALYCMKQHFIIKTTFLKNGCSFSNERFPIVPGIWNWWKHWLKWLILWVFVSSFQSIQTKSNTTWCCWNIEIT